MIQTDAAPGRDRSLQPGDPGRRLVFTAGQVGLDPATGELAGGRRGTGRPALANVRAVLEAAGSGLDRVVKATVFLADMADFATVNEVYGRGLIEPFPARSTFAVKQLPKGALVEIEVIALAGADGEASRRSDRRASTIGAIRPW